MSASAAKTIDPIALLEQFDHRNALRLLSHAARTRDRAWNGPARHSFVVHLHDHR